MKKKLLFGALVLIMIIGAKPNSARAQDKKEISKTIIIKNGDTIINGKNLKNVSKSERKKLLKELDGMKLDRQQKLDGGDHDVQVIIRKKKDGVPEEVTVKHLKSPGAMAFNGDMMPRHFKMDGDSMRVNVEVDSILKTVRMHMNGLDSNMNHQFRVMRRGNGDDDLEVFVNPPMPPDAPMAPRMMMMSPDAPGFRMERPNAKNSQSFSYSNTDKDGTNNRLNIRLSEVAPDALKQVGGSENPKTDLSVEDLTLFPSFSTGKTNLAFNLKSKGAVEVKILDNNFQTLFTDKQPNFNESYYKSFSLPKNGVYYLSISQNGHWFVKKVVKE